MWRNLLLFILVMLVLYWKPLWHRWLQPGIARLALRIKQDHSPLMDNTMSIEQAQKILGVDAHANRDEIVLAHKRLIQKLHPDRGGNPYLATQVNLAKQTLIDQFKAG